MSITLEQVKQQIKTLTPEEQQQVRAFLDAPTLPVSEETTEEQERRFAEHLLAKGIISHIPASMQDGYVPDDSYKRYSPIVVHGEPVSETIIRERR